MPVADILHGPVTVNYAPVGEALPADSVAVGVAWGGNWKKFGLTKEPLSCNYDFDELDIEVQEALAPVDRVRIKESLVLETVLAEITADNLNLAANGTVTKTVAGAGQVGKEEVDVGGSGAIAQFAWGFEGTFVTDAGVSFPVRFFLYKGTAKANGALEQGRELSPGIGIQVKGLADTGKAVGKQLFKWQKVTAAAQS
jgi:hypothetical protein